MNLFSIQPPDWSEQAVHAVHFCCPQCQSGAAEAVQVWINRSSPVMTEEYHRIWQEFYACKCGQAWWSWSRDRPPNPLDPDQE